MNFDVSHRFDWLPEIAAWPLRLNQIWKSISDMLQRCRPAAFWGFWACDFCGIASHIPLQSCGDSLFFCYVCSIIRVNVVWDSVQHQIFVGWGAFLARV